LKVPARANRKGSWDANLQKSRKAVKEKHALDLGKIGTAAVAAGVRFAAAALLYRRKIVAEYRSQGERVCVTSVGKGPSIVC
jgi:hypothetical protein